MIIVNCSGKTLCMKLCYEIESDSVLTKWITSFVWTYALQLDFIVQDPSNTITWVS